MPFAMTTSIRECKCGYMRLRTSLINIFASPFLADDDSAISD